jgi:glycosyltransferase involved in cell wall biosynthesis
MKKGKDLKISIVTPSYNRGDYLEETIQSVLGQNYPNLEYIIIDGGSTDNSVEIIEKYADKIHYWVSEKDKGLYHAIQKGFDKSSGEIMAWINSDDVYSKGAFDICNQVFCDFENILWLTGNTAHVDEKSRIINTLSPKRWGKYNYLFGDYKFIQQESTFWRRSLWDTTGSKISQEYPLAGDLELWSRFFNVEPVCSINAILGLFRLRSSNQKSLEGFDQYEKEALMIINAYLSDEEKHRMIRLKKWASLPLFWRLFQNRYESQLIHGQVFNLDRRNQKFILENK